MSTDTRVLLQPAFVLHQRPYRNTSAILELLTPGHGRVGVVAKGARGLKSRLKGILQPFVPLFVSWQGQGELVTLLHAEGAGLPILLSGRAALNGFYLNELLVRLLPRRDPAESLFDVYRDTLPMLADGDREQCALRYFEKALLQELGYGLVLDHDVETGEPIVPEWEYTYLLEQGPVHRVGAAVGPCLSGHSLLAFAHHTLNDPESLRAVKHLTRAVLAQQLGGKPLKSRELFKALQPKAAKD